VRRILIAGCGYVGQAAADLFHQAGWEVEGWTKTETSLEKPYPIIAVDVSQRAQVNSRSGNFDAVIHCASTRGGDADLYRQVYLEGARNLLDRFVGSTVLFTSSTSVYGQRAGEIVTEESETNPVSETAKVLLETEKLVLGGGGVVARLAGIYGPGRSALLKKFLNGGARLEPENDRFINQVHRDDVAAALFLLLNERSPAAQVFNVVDDNPIRQSECYRWLSERLGRPPDARGGSASSRKRGLTNKRVSNAKLRGRGWVPRYPSFAEGMEKSVLPNEPSLSSLMV
jgi:nucleoside-diphosphate-sugar epimerase